MAIPGRLQTAAGRAAYLAARQGAAAPVERFADRGTGQPVALGQRRAADGGDIRAKAQQLLDQHEGLLDDPVEMDRQCRRYMTEFGVETYSEAVGEVLAFTKELRGLVGQIDQPDVDQGKLDTALQAFAAANTPGSVVSFAQALREADRG